MNIRNQFPSPWISADDLGNKKFELVVEGVTLEEVHDRQTNKKVQKVVVAFVGAKKRLILNKTNGLAFASVCGSDETDDWKGKRVALRAGKAHNGKPTVVVEAAAVSAPAAAAAMGHEEE